MLEHTCVSPTGMWKASFDIVHMTTDKGACCRSELALRASLGLDLGFGTTIGGISGRLGWLYAYAVVLETFGAEV